MQFLKSFGLSFFILAGAAIWLGTGTLVMGGQGPGNGEHSIVGLIEGDDHGPISTALADAGVLPEHSSEDVELARMTVAERVAQANGSEGSSVSVRTETFERQQMPIEVTLRGKPPAAANVSAVAETTAVVETVHVSKGDQVEAGDLLCSLAPGTRAAAVAQAEAGLAQAQAGLAQAQLDLETNTSLRERGLAPANTANSVQVALAGAEAQVSSAQAALDNALAELDRTEIVAEVSGLVQAPIATRGSMLSQGGVCATIVQLDPIVFSGSVAEANITLARTGLPATLNTVTDQDATGEVTYVAASADDATRSFPVEIEFANPDFAIREGVTATATVNMGSMPGHLLPQSVLTLNDAGVLGVRSVEDGIVAFHPVTIVSDTRDGVWVTGLPASIEIITIGQEFVVDGQAVRAGQEAVSGDVTETSKEGAPA
ncbi:efflux transporter, RND family, MFP subunit [Pelagibacterium halotolerans B2]|uniref:Efflux transporter, RND family, MFP subunit n=1 Tax=Pelagibacterium halotolerans (strain DSM 22347 / JCM 15775 / CGMCC 1.7692 / B2) TaxID=1082931 RepID=G4RF69_PELHB|nr:efflux RND transporter periplasmic adaptor subunit [Pelagibacterium halotolerans]AEQ50937.1 efflux transporter, RND family, MFP subunit [Pelagibacterium halotolerans B2]